MKVLHVTPSFYPAIRWGGPIYSTKAVCDGVAESGVELKVLTTDAAGIRPTDRLEDSGKTIQFPAGYSVTYFKRIASHSFSPKLLLSLRKNIDWADLIHLTGTYNSPTVPTISIARCMSKPIVWSPRGALQASEQWSGNSNLNAKRIFEGLVAALLPSNSILLATSDQEAETSKARIGDVRTAVVPNSVAVPSDLSGREPNRDLFRIMFLSRIHQKKGIERLIETLDKLPDNCRLDIYGDGEKNYVARLKQLSSKFAGRITFHGHVEGEAKRLAFVNADLFVLPSYSENFGIAIAEALAHGTPVVTTTCTPWTNLDKIGCGTSVNLDEVDLAATILKIKTDNLRAKGELGRVWVSENLSNTATSRSIMSVYRELTHSDAGTAA